MCHSIAFVSFCLFYCCFGNNIIHTRPRETHIFLSSTSLFSVKSIVHLFLSFTISDSWWNKSKLVKDSASQRCDWMQLRQKEIWWPRRQKEDKRKRRERECNLGNWLKAKDWRKKAWTSKDTHRLRQTMNNNKSKTNQNPNVSVNTALIFGNNITQVSEGNHGENTFSLF